MPFDPNTAVLDTPAKGFDPSTASLDETPSNNAPKSEWEAYYKQQAQNKANAPKKDLVDTLAGASPKQLDEQGHWVAGGLMQTAKDVASIPLNYLNQLAFNYPRSIANTAGYTLPFESDNPAAQAANKVAGVAGALQSPLNKLGLNGVMSGNVNQAMANGAISGLAYAPTDNVFDMKDRAINAASGGLVGGAAEKVLNPLLKDVPTKLEELAQKNTKIYRDLLRPTQGEVNKVEIKSGKNIDDYYKLAGDEGLIIKQTPDKKLDTSDAVAQLQGKKAELNNQLDQMLTADKEKRFNLQGLGIYAKDALAERIPNASEREAAMAKVDEYIDAEIKAHGRLVTAKDLNRIKQGMWSVSYNMLSPNNNKVARQIGYTAKDMIEAAYPDMAIRSTNAKLGEYLTLEDLLQNAQGRVVKGGRLGKYVGNIVGATAGGMAGAIGHAIPVVGPILGPAGTLAGAHLGGEIASAIHNPERITSGVQQGVVDTATPIRKAISGLTSMPSTKNLSDLARKNTKRRTP